MSIDEEMRRISLAANIECNRQMRERAGMSEQAGDKFHAHLDVCRRCENEPWNLCPVGAALLKQSAAEITNQFKHLYPVRQV